MIGHNKGSVIVNVLDDILEEYLYGIDLYEEEAFDAITNYFIKKEIKFQGFQEKGLCAFAFIDENNYPQLFSFDIVYKEDIE